MGSTIEYHWEVGFMGKRSSYNSSKHENAMMECHYLQIERTWMSLGIGNHAKTLCMTSFDESFHKISWHPLSIWWSLEFNFIPPCVNSFHTLASVVGCKWNAMHIPFAMSWFNLIHHISSEHICLVVNWVAIWTLVHYHTCPCTYTTMLQICWQCQCWHAFQ